MAAECGKCKNCMDKPKFGGPGKIRQKCLEKICLHGKEEEKRKKTEKVQAAVEKIKALTEKKQQLIENRQNNLEIKEDSSLESVWGTSAENGFTLQKTQDQIAMEEEIERIINVHKTNELSITITPLPATPEQSTEEANAEETNKQHLEKATEETINDETNDQHKTIPEDDPMDNESMEPKNDGLEITSVTKKPLEKKLVEEVEGIANNLAQSEDFNLSESSDEEGARFVQRSSGTGEEVAEAPASLTTSTTSSTTSTTTTTEEAVSSITREEAVEARGLQGLPTLAALGEIGPGIVITRLPPPPPPPPPSPHHLASLSPHHLVFASTHPLPYPSPST